MPINLIGRDKKSGLNKYRVRINYTDSYGKAHQVERIAYGSDQAKLTEIALLQEYCERTVPERRMTVQDLYEEYINQKTHEVRESTMRKLIGYLSNHVLPYLGDTRLDKLNMKVLTEWKSAVAEKEIGIRMKQNIYGDFRAMLNYAVKMEYLPKNPLLSVGNFKDAYDIAPKKEKLHYYTSEDFKKFIAVAKENSTTVENNTYYVFFMIAYYTGMRKGEINALKWTDIEENILHVRRSITQKLKGGDRETPPKNRSSFRSLQIPTPLQKALDEHKEWQQRVYANFTEDFRICGGMRCLRDTSIENRNKEFAERAGLEHIRIHDFRHSHASLLANEGINIQEIARRLGHAKIEMTWNTYSHLYPREEERAIKVLNNIF